MGPLQTTVDDHAFLAGLDGRALGLICGCARTVHFEPGQFLLREGESADEFYLLRQGRVALQVSAAGRHTVTLQTIGESDIVGLSWLIPPYRWTYDARALEPVEALAVDAACLRQKCEADHDFGYSMMKRFVPPLVQRLQAARLQMLDVYGPA